MRQETYHSNIMTSQTTQADKPLELARKVGILRPWDLDTYGIYHPGPVLTTLVAPAICSRMAGDCVYYRTSAPPNIICYR